MAKNDKINMPSSTAGVTRFFDEYKSKLQITPSQVVALAIVVMVIIIAMHQFGKGLLGLP